MAKSYRWTETDLAERERRLKQPASRTREAHISLPAISLPQTPQELLTFFVRQEWPEERIECNYKTWVPGRKLELDIALPRLRYGIEVDGWEHHGKYLGDWKRDREKDRLAHLLDWVIVRVPATDITGNLSDVMLLLRVVYARRGRWLAQIS